MISLCAHSLTMSLRRPPFEIPSTMVCSLILWRKLARVDIQIMDFFILICDHCQGIYHWLWLSKTLYSIILRIFLFTITLLRVEIVLDSCNIYREIDNGDWTNICTFLDYFLHFHPIVFPFSKIFNVLCLHTKSFQS